MDRKLMEKIILVGTIGISILMFWLDIGSEWLLHRLLRTKLTPIAYRDFEQISFLVSAGIILVLVVSILCLCYNSDYPEEDGE